MDGTKQKKTMQKVLILKNTLELNVVLAHFSNEVSLFIDGKYIIYKLFILLLVNINFCIN